MSRKVARSVRARSVAEVPTGGTACGAAVPAGGAASETRRPRENRRVRAVMDPPNERLSALHRARGEPGDEEALEQHEGRDHGHEADEAGRTHELPVRLVAAL